MIPDGRQEESRDSGGGWKMVEGEESEIGNGGIGSESRSTSQILKESSDQVREENRMEWNQKKILMRITAPMMKVSEGERVKP